MPTARHNWQCRRQRTLERFQIYQNLRIVANRKGKDHDRIFHVTLDLQSTTKEAAEQLKDVSADYVFFGVYLAKGSASEAAKVNNAMLQNFLEAPVITGTNN
jgi:hypothetical protein